MKVKRYLLDRMKQMLYLLFVLLGVLLLTLTVHLCRESFHTYLVFIISGWIVYFILLAVMVTEIIFFHRKLARKYELFYNGTIYGDFFEGEGSISEETDLAMEKLRQMIENTDILNLSKQQAQYLALQNQINPHFLYNTLESIRSDALCNDMDDIAQITGALSLFFRYTISNTDKISSLSDELENVENYFIIQKYRFGERIDLKIILPETIDCTGMAIPKLTLQPIVENAIIHGVECLGTKGIINICVEVGQNGYYINIEDNGCGIPLEELKRLNSKLSLPGVMTEDTASRKGGGIALRNVSQRIKLLFGEEYGVKIYSTVDVGTKVQVWLPISYANEAR